MDEARDLAYDVGAARIIVHTACIIVGMAGTIIGAPRIIVGTDLINVRTNGYIAGARRIEVSTWGNKGSLRGIEGSSPGEQSIGVGKRRITAGE